MTRKHAGTGLVVLLVMIAAPVAYALGWSPLAVLFVAAPGAAAALVALDMHRKSRVEQRRAAQWQKSLDRRLRAQQRRVAKWQESVNEQLAAAAREQEAAAREQEALGTRQAEQRLEELQWRKSTDRGLAELTELVRRPPARTDVATQEDILGAVRVLQARYEGRLDHAQTTLEDAAEALRSQLSRASSEAGPEERAWPPIEE